MKNARPLLLRKIGEMAVDSIIIPIAFVVSYFLRVGSYFSTDFPFSPYIVLSLIITPAFLFFFAWSGLYALEEKRPLELLRAISVSCLAGSMLFVLIFFFKREIFFSRLILLFIWGISTTFVFGFHLGIQQIWARQYERGKNVLRTLLVGNGKTAMMLTQELQKKRSRFQPIAALAPYGGGEKILSKNVPVLGKLDALERVCKEQKIDAIIQTEAPEQTPNLLLFAEGKYLEFLLAPSVIGAFRTRFHLEHTGEYPVIRFGLSPLFGWGQVAKRGLDLLISFFVLLIFFPWLLFCKKTKIICATGPSTDVFEKLAFLHTKNRYFFHLPEFWNVFCGQMSLVGPRPRTEDERENMPLFERRRLVIKPGIFGPSQLCLLEKKQCDARHSTEIDTAYILHWSFRKDIALLAKSFFLLLFHRS
ncbi:sugar transferase [Candidatus Peregrinibacteria bacterium]|nr:MAG: sugar transferase [Candidatus Peregrinibacteria bacterium]